MRKVVLVLACVVMIVPTACMQPPLKPQPPKSTLTQEEKDGFKAAWGPAARLLLGVGNGVKDWDRDGTREGVELFVRLLDANAASTKRAGGFLFEVYSYSFDTISHKGDLLAGWSVDASKAIGLWESGLRPGYRFRFSWPGEPPKGRLALLYITFTDTEGGEVRLEAAPLKLPE